MQPATYFVFLASESLEIAPGNFIHGICIAQVGSCFKVLSRGCRILLDAPAVAKAVSQFENS